MNHLIPLHTQTLSDESIQTVNARELHAFLENGDHFATWIKDRVEQYNFLENQDFMIYSENTEKRGRPRREVFVTLDMAKELAMVERNAKGKQARQYFIECEKRLRGENVHFILPKDLPNALRLAADLAEKVENQKTVIAYLEPLAEFHDRVAEAINCQTIQEVAKVLGVGPNRFFAWLRDRKILMKNNQPYQQHIDQGHFKMVENQYTDQRREVHTYTRTLITGKGLIYLQKHYQQHAA